MNQHNRNTPMKRPMDRISAYTSAMGLKTLARMLCTRSSRPKWYTGTPGFSTIPAPHPNTQDHPLFYNNGVPGLPTLILLHLRVDYYMRHALLLGRFIDEATGPVGFGSGRRMDQTQGVALHRSKTDLLQCSPFIVPPNLLCSMVKPKGHPCIDRLDRGI